MHNSATVFSHFIIYEVHFTLVAPCMCILKDGVCSAGDLVLNPACGTQNPFDFLLVRRVAICV